MRDRVDYVAPTVSVRGGEQSDDRTKTAQVASAASRRCRSHPRGASRPRFNAGIPIDTRFWASIDAVGLARFLVHTIKSSVPQRRDQGAIKRGDVGEVRFLREAMITARLEHPGIVPVHEAGQWPDGTPFYVMKLVSGRSLKEMIARCKNVAERMGLLDHVIAVADAVAYAHKRHIIHRDLKPANVIVGDFGETVVIDWGLAKDLSESDDRDLERGPFRAPALDDLTATGSVLGTPSYMAPEQGRGERVDHRADVFAIGAMLWELCSTHRVPPNDVSQRDRMLRRAKVATDLIAIISKALAGDAGRRYRDAGELAADLNAFAVGARIASRRYSLLGLLMHWIRLNRALASTLAAASVLALVGALVFVRNIAVERDRAETHQRRAERASDELLLQNAELLLQRDPTAVVALLADYRGSEMVRKQRVLAEARGRGVAEVAVTPHSDTVWFVAGDATGAVISLGEDHRLRVTKDRVSTTLASNASLSMAVAHAPQKKLLAYATSPSGIAVLDLSARTSRNIPAARPEMMTLSADGSRLAMFDAQRALTVWNLSPLEIIHRATVGDAVDLKFADPETLIIREQAAIRSISVTGSHPTSRFASPSSHTFDALSSAVAIGNTRGTITLLGSSLVPVAELSVCRTRVNSVRFVQRGELLAYACAEGMRAWSVTNIQRKELTVTSSFEVDGAAIFAEPDSEGRRIIVVVEAKTISVYDVETKLVTSYHGQPAEISMVAAPTSELDRIVVGDGRWQHPGVVTADERRAYGDEGAGRRIWRGGLA